VGATEGASLTLPASSGPREQEKFASPFAVLGVVEKLSSEQIGALLAAIAGYVLGKGATRSRLGSGGEQAAVQAPRPGKEGDK
jgi:hypothetical protein